MRLWKKSSDRSSKLELCETINQEITRSWKLFLRQKEDLIATLTAEKNELWNDNHQLIAQNNELQRRIADLDLDQNTVDEQLRDRLQQINDQEVELENRAQIIETLKEHLSDLDEQLADYEQTRAEASQLRRQLARLNDRDRNSVPPEPSSSYNSRRMSPAQPKATSTELTRKVEELNDELQYRKQLFADLCSFVPKAKIRQDDTLDVKTAKLIQYIGKLLEYVTKSHSMVEGFGEATSILELKIRQGAKESGFHLPDELFGHGQNLNLSRQLNSRKNKLGPCGIEREISEELGRIYRTIRPQSK
ncbi:hypothetical protein M3Y94_00203400 [Aphelenchoides besseyi]|nr:hypothetical protein M3Y94_00203400 [Aphelenchoides besseyi]